MSWRESKEANDTEHGRGRWPIRHSGVEQRRNKLDVTVLEPRYEGVFPRVCDRDIGYVIHGQVGLSLPCLLLSLHTWPSEPLILNGAIVCESGEVELRLPE